MPVVEGVAAGQQEQIVDELLEPDRLVQHAALGAEQVGRSRLGKVELELAADPGQRPPQLVGGVGDEPLLTSYRVLEPVQGLVHRPGEPVDLVPRAGLGNAAVEVGSP